MTVQVYVERNGDHLRVRPLRGKVTAEARRMLLQHKPALMLCAPAKVTYIKGEKVYKAVRAAL